MTVRHTIIEIIGNFALVAFYDDDRRATQERTVLVPMNPNGSIDEAAFSEVLAGQAASFENKVSVGLVPTLALSEYYETRTAQETRRQQVLTQKT